MWKDLVPTCEACDVCGNDSDTKIVERKQLIMVCRKCYNIFERTRDLDNEYFFLS